MAKRKQHYEIREHVSGSFIGATGRVRYEVEAGVVTEGEIDPEVLDVLLATGTAVKAAKPAESEESA
jgi:hypothetical protein